MEWVEDCAWLQENVPLVAGQELPALLESALAYRNEALALAETIRHMEEAATEFLDLLTTMIGSQREVVERHDTALRQAVTGLADAIGHVLRELAAAQHDLQEHVDQAATEFDALGAVVVHASGELAGRRSKAEASLADAAGGFQGVVSRLIESTSVATGTVGLLSSETSAADQASRQGVEALTARIEAIGESGPKHIDTVRALVASLALDLQSDAGAALDRLAAAVSPLLGKLSEDPQTIGEALDETCQGMQEPAARLLTLLSEAVVTLAEARGAVGPAADDVAAERAALSGIVDAARVAAVLLNTDWGAVLPP